MTERVDESGVPLPPPPWQYGDRLFAAMAAPPSIATGMSVRGCVGLGTGARLMSSE